MSDNEVNTTVVTADIAPQDVQDEATKDVAENIDENGKGSAEEIKAEVEVPENDLKTADEGTSVDKIQDTDVPAGNDIESTEDNGANEEGMQLAVTDVPVGEDMIVVNEGEGDENAKPTIEGGTEEDAEKAITAESTKTEELHEVEDETKEDTTSEIKEDTTTGTKEDAASEVEDGMKIEVDAEKEADESSAEEVNGEAGKEVEGDVAERINDISADDIKENTTEEVKGVSVDEDAVEEVEDTSMELEDVKDGAAEDKEEVVEEVKEDAKGDIEDGAAEDKADVVEEVKDGAAEDAVEDDKDVAMDEGKNDGKEAKEDTIAEINEDTAPPDEVDAEKETNKCEAATTPLKERTASEDGKDTAMEDVSSPDVIVIDTQKKVTRGRKSKKVQESPYSLRGETKRERKAANHFEPGNFIEDRKKSSDFSVPPGKGTKLTDIPSVKTKIDKTVVKDPTLIAAHKFVFGGRGVVNKKFLKKQLLGFSGYLPVKNEGEEEEEKGQENQDDDAISEKFVARANKLVVPLLKSICDLFDVDRTPPPRGKVAALDKEAIIDRLLKFLAAPHVKFTNAGKRTTKKRGRASLSKSPKKKKAKKTEEVELIEIEYDEEEEEEEEEEEKVVKGARGSKMPTKKQLRKFVRAYITCFSLEKTTTKHLIKTASDKFEVDVTSKKKDILHLLTAEIPNKPE